MPERQKVPVAVIQFEPLLNALEENRERVQEKILEALSKEPQLIVLPELAFSGYNFEKEKDAVRNAEQIPNSKSCRLLDDLARDHSVYIVSGIDEKTDEGLYNSAVVFGPEGYIQTYRKIHLYSREKLYFLAGSKPPRLFDMGDVKVGTMVCFDWFFPEFPRTLAMMGADIIAHPMNAVIREGAYIGNICHSKWSRVAILLANRIGVEGDLTFIGMSQITDPTGKVLCRASEDQEEILHATIDTSLSRNKKINAFNNVLMDRRPEFYFKNDLNSS
ncbi:MAG: nitrilase-related carbon-nitrogen hydrolase [Candidatus Helarchaeota archaeon]